jgi:hypothetical protein
MLDTSQQIETLQGIVIVTTGIQPHLLCALYQTRFRNPSTPIYLLSYRNPNLKFVTWIDLSKYENSWKIFSNAYVHLSSNEEWFERICYYRWFALEAFMREKNLSCVAHLDTDILTFQMLNPINLDLPTSSFSVISSFQGSTSGHTSFLTSITPLTNFINFCVNIYQDPQSLQVLKDFYARKQLDKEEGGVCDMYALGWACGWKDNSKAIMRFVELNDPISFGVAFDNSITDNGTAYEKDFWVTESNRKKIVTNVAGHKCFVTTNGQIVPIVSAHCQGQSKSKMLNLMESRPSGFYLRWIRASYNEAARRSKNRFSASLERYRKSIQRRVSGT